MKYIALVIVLLALTAPNPSRNTSQDRQPYRHAYYLFQENPVGCGACYIPLLITKEPLAEGPKTQEIKDCIPIVTYERDSIWQTLSPVTINGAEVNGAERKIRITLYSEKDSNSILRAIAPPGAVIPAEKSLVPVYKDISFRYQEITPAEVIKLLENPRGTIPISRPFLPQAPLNFAELISDFKSNK